MNSLKEIVFQRRRPTLRPPSSRVRRFEISLPLRWQLVIRLRKFRTSPSRDSKRYRQLIIEVNDSQVREIALALIKRSKSKRQRNIATTPIFYRARVRAAAAAFLVIAGLGSAVFFGTNLQKPVNFNITASHTAKVLAAPTASGKVMPKSLPVHLRIPKIGVDTDLSQVGLQANGAMEMPWDIGTAAWYKYSPTPGELGPSVIVGHLDGANFANMTGVFYRLRELAPGDQFTVTRTDGTNATFKVLSLKQVPQNNFPTQDIYGNINYAGIRLITCGGTFDTNTNHYTDNTVVFGALE
jgi:sortase (surface protein transpeptidase)